MKKLLFIFNFAFCANVFATNLFDYTVYIKENIQAECSDFMGLTAAGGNINLRDFLIQNDEVTTKCPLEAWQDLRMTRGSVQGPGGFACVRALRFFPDNTGVTTHSSPSASFSALNKAMNNASQKLSVLKTGHGVSVKRLSAEDFLAGHSIHLKTYSNDVLVLNVSGEVISFEKVGIILEGSARPSSIIWNFVDAKTLIIKSTGTNILIDGLPMGLPGTILAPQAKVIGNDARISGSLFAKEFVGLADSSTCSGSVSLQVNRYCFRSNIPGVGCGKPQTGGKD